MEKTKLGHVHLYGFNIYFNEKCTSINEQTQNIRLFQIVEIRASHRKSL